MAVGMRGRRGSPHVGAAGDTRSGNGAQPFCNRIMARNRAPSLGAALNESVGLGTAVEEFEEDVPKAPA